MCCLLVKVVVKQVADKKGKGLGDPLCFTQFLTFLDFMEVETRLFHSTFPTLITSQHFASIVDYSDYSLRAPSIHKTNQCFR